MSARTTVHPPTPTARQLAGGLLAAVALTAGCTTSTSRAPAAASAAPTAGPSASGHSSAATPPTSTRPSPRPSTEPVLLPTPQGALHWTPLGRRVHGHPALYLGRLGGTSLVWMDTRLVRLTLVAGTLDPPGIARPGGGQVPAADRPGLLAAFNAGFQLKDMTGGWYADGRYARALQPGQASLVVGTAGTPTVAAWGRDARMAPGVGSVRQNLQLVVDAGRLTPDVRTRPSVFWGPTIRGLVAAHRSGACLDRHRALVYLYSQATSVPDLGRAMLAAGCVRGMQLDINPQWLSFNTYAVTARGVRGMKVLGIDLRPNDRYLAPDARDFYAVTARP